VTTFTKDKPVVVAPEAVVAPNVVPIVVSSVVVDGSTANTPLVDERTKTRNPN
jgi:hypothetical protein